MRNKEIAKVTLDINVEYDDSRKNDLLDDLSKYFNSKNNKSSMMSVSLNGVYIWKLSNKNAIVELITK